MRSRSRRIGCAALTTLLAAAIVPLPAGAFFRLDFNGHVKQDPDSYVGFNLNRTPTGKRKVAFLTTGRIQFACEGGSSGRTEFLTLDGSFQPDLRCRTGTQEWRATTDD